MYYQVLVHHIFHNPALYNVEMEHDRSLIVNSPVYEDNKVLIDEYISLENMFSQIFQDIGKVTKFVSPDETEQVIQIECLREDADLFLLHPDFMRFQDLRTLVAADIFECTFADLPSTTEAPTTTLDSYASARSKFPE